MIVEGLGSVTFVNGILRVQLTAIDPDGKVRESGIVEIPGAKVGDIIQGLANAAQGISDKINDGSDSSSEKEKKKSTKKDSSKNKKAN
tara:strand:+ start:235 stop:498 length:264 start_codon:yes stop_codon:yes gene_type:complete